MVSRRLRIIEVTQALLSEGDGQFTMRDLATKCGVATGTLYNLYGSQDALIADAVTDIFERRVLDMAAAAPNASLYRAITARQDAAYQEIMRAPIFARIMVELYFSGEPNSRVWQVLHTIPTETAINQLEQVKALGDLEDWVDIPRLADQVIRANYAVVSSWATGMLSDEEFAVETLYGAYAMILGALKGTSRAEVKAALLQLKQPPSAKDKMQG